jgi:uracil-DNA glycosylase
LQEAGIERDHVYVTNAVKHFKFTLRGKRRLHKKPSAMEIRACRPWLEAEVAAIKPPVLIALGATAGQSLFGPAFRVTRQHGKVFESEWAPHCMGTVHPSAVLRALQDADRRRMYRDFVDDLRHVAKFVRG